MNVITHRPLRAARAKGLTDIAVRNARARDRAYKRSDGCGLCLLVQPNGSKWWRFRYEWMGKEKMLSMDTYPDTSLAQARNRRDEARRRIEAGTDPSMLRRLAEHAPERTFEAVALHYLAGLEMKEQHIVPLSQQALQIVRELLVIAQSRVNSRCPHRVPMRVCCVSRRERRHGAPFAAACDD